MVIQFHTVCHHHEGPVTGEFPQHLLGKKHHGKAFAAALGLPEYATPAMALLAGFQHGSDGIVHAQELVVLPQYLDQACLVFGKKGEVFHQIQQAVLGAGAAQHHFQRNAPGFIFPFYALPFKETVPICGEGTHTAFRTIAGNEEGVEPEKLRDLLLVMLQVFIKGGTGGDTGLFQFHHHPGQAIDEAHQIRPTGIKAADNTDLADQQKIIVFRLRPIHHAQAFGFLPAIFPIWH